MIKRLDKKFTAAPHNGKTILEIRHLDKVYYIDSPYNSATTAYLKQTYPDYWNQIKAFGKSHKNLVEFINEDNDLIVSLVSVGKVRAVLIPANDYADFGFIPTHNTNTDLSFRIKYIDSNDWFGSNTNLNGGGGYPILRISGNSTGIRIDTSVWYSLRLWFENNSRTRHFSINGQEFAGSASDSANNFLLGALGGATNNKGHYYVDGLQRKENGVIVGRYYPFKRNGQMELLDIVTGTLATRVGTFTELIE